MTGESQNERVRDHELLKVKKNETDDDQEQHEGRKGQGRGFEKMSKTEVPVEFRREFETHTTEYGNTEIKYKYNGT